MRTMRGPVLGLVCVLVLTVVFLRGVVHVTTPQADAFARAGMAGVPPAPNH